MLGFQKEKHVRENKLDPAHKAAVTRSPTGRSMDIQEVQRLCYLDGLSHRNLVRPDLLPFGRAQGLRRTGREPVDTLSSKYRRY